MVAIAIHQIAAWIWNLDLSLHKYDEMSNFVPPEKKDVGFWNRFHGKPPATYFSHKWYQDHDQYPDGVADGVGYWAESRILGGVVLFDRRSPEVRRLRNVSSPTAMFDPVLTFLEPSPTPYISIRTGTKLPIAFTPF